MEMTGSQNYSQLARIMGITPQRLQYLKNGGGLTCDLAMKIERLSNGRIQRHHLMPELFEGYRPNCSFEEDQRKSA